MRGHSEAWSRLAQLTPTPQSQRTVHTGSGRGVSCRRKCALATTSSSQSMSPARVGMTSSHADPAEAVSRWVHYQGAWMAGEHKSNKGHSLCTHKQIPKGATMGATM
jgi:hypothetical protein